MPYYVYKITSAGRRLLSEHLHVEDAIAKASNIRGAVVADEHGTVVTE